jgi:hypothetical protein
MEQQITLWAIIALVLTVLMAVVVYGVIAPIFTGPEITAWKTLGNEIDAVCGADTNTVQQISIVLPDSRGNTPLNLVFFYLAVDQDNFILARRTYGAEKNDILVNFVDWVRSKPGNKIIRERVLDNCLNNNVRICGQLDPNKPLDLKCNSFQFESGEGNEALSFTITKTTVNRIDTVVLSYTRATVCGDGRCCEPEQASDASKPNYCPQDCESNKRCTPFTEGA